MVFNKKTNWNKTLFSIFCNYKTIFIIQRKYLQGEFGYLSDPLSCGIGKLLLDLSSGNSRVVSLETLVTFTERK